MEHLPYFASGYFLAESEATALGFLTAMAAVALAVYFIFIVRTPFMTGLGYTLLLVALFIGPASAYVFFRTQNQVIILSEQYQTDQKNFVSQETERMRTVIDRYKYARMVQAATMLAGLLLLLIPSLPLYKGIAVGLIWFAVLNFVTEYYSGVRAILYLQQLIQ